MLVLMASTPRAGAGQFDYLHELTSQGSCRIIVKHIDRTNHSFVKGPGKEAVRTHIEQWLIDCFPAAKNDTNAPQNAGCL